MARSNNYFGVNVPVFRLKKPESGAFTIWFVIQGPIVSKKNNQQAVVVKKDAKKHLQDTYNAKGSITLQDALNALNMVKAKMIGNVAYNGFLERFRPIIKEQMGAWERRLSSKGVKFPLSEAFLTIKFFRASRHRTDNVNKQQTIQDLLVDCGVLVDDNDMVIPSIATQSASYYKEIEKSIALIMVSFKVEQIENSS